MVFCGQCGLQLSPGMTRCPRCGTETEIAADNNMEPLQADSPTIAAAYIQRPTAFPSQQAFPATSPEQQQLVLRPDSNGNYDYAAASGNEQTSAMNAPDYHTHSNTPQNFHSGVPYPAPSQAVNYPAQTSTVHQSQPGNFAAPAFTQPVSAGGAASFGYTPQQKKRRGGGVLTLLVVVGLLLLLGVGGFFVVQRSGILGNTTRPATGGTNGGGTTQNTPLAPPDQAKAVVQHYYTSINNKSYPEAYSLWRWGAKGPTLASFENGYVNTEHDDLMIKNATQLSDGTVKVLMTVVATERINGAIKYHTYAGYYIVGQDGGTWKIFRGYLNRIK